MKTAQAENVVGVFASDESARAAVSFLEHAGFPPDDVAVVRDDIRRARELTGSRSPQGSAIGIIVGLLLFVGYALVGGPPLRSDPVALALGLIGLAVAGAAIDALVGRSRAFVADRGARYEDAIASGRVLVSLHVKDGERDRARRLLREAGATHVKEEGTVEAA